MNLGISFFNIHLLILFCKNVFYFLLYLIFSGSAKSSRADNGITFYYTFTPAGLLPPGFFMYSPLAGKASACRLGEFVERTKYFRLGKTEVIRVAICFWLLPGSGTFCKQSLHFGIVLGSTRVNL